MEISTPKKKKGRLQYGEDRECSAFLYKYVQEIKAELACLRQGGAVIEYFGKMTKMI